MIRENRGILIGLGAGILAMVIILLGVSTTMNNSCQSAFWENLEAEIYPGAELVDKQADFLGVQRAVYYTPDAVPTVNEWYRTERAEQMRTALANINLNSLPSDRWVIAPAEGREGSTLTLQTQCP